MQYLSDVIRVAKREGKTEILENVIKEADIEYISRDLNNKDIYQKYIKRIYDAYLEKIDNGNENTIYNVL